MIPLLFQHPDLIATQLAQDKRVAEAKRLLSEALKDHKKNITKVRPPITALKQSYDELIKKFSEERGGKLWFPYIGTGIGNGALVELADGSIKYDFICGVGVNYWGHNHQDLLNSSIDAALSNTVLQGHLQQNLDTVALSNLLTQTSKFPHCFLCSSGAIANENALKIAFQKKHPASRVLAFERCFIGRTLAESQITDKPGFREGLPPALFVDYIPFYDPLDPEGSTKRSVETLKKLLNRYPNQHAIMCFELIQGEAGFHTAPREFFIALMSILKEKKIAILCDEVQSFGRTSELFSFQYFNLQEYVDIVTIGKLSQVCATLYSEEYKPRPGLLSQTVTSSTAAIKAALVIIDSLMTQNYFGPNGKIASLNQYFTKKLQNLSSRYSEIIHGPFGIGSMIAFTPYDGSTQKTTDFINRLFNAGVISFIGGGSPYPARVRFLIPIGAVTTHDIDRVIELIEHTLLEHL